MKKLCVLGSSSSIIEGLVRELEDNDDIDIVLAGRRESDDVFLDINQRSIERTLERIPLTCDVYVIALGVLYPKQINEQRTEETFNSLTVNLVFPVKLIEMLIDRNPVARVIVLGSESGIKGSYDTTYFLSKTALASYIREKRIKFKEQQVLMVSPSVIEDSRMTRSRGDLDDVYAKARDLPKQRLLLTKEVVELLIYLINGPSGYINNEVININGGKFARMDYRRSGGTSS